jgi:flagellar L-ring protein FlgH
MKYLIQIAAVLLTLAPLSARNKKPPKHSSQVSPIDRYIAEAEQRSRTSRAASSPGSLYSAGGRLGDAFRDMRANQVDDIVTVLVSDKASAVSSGTTNTSRKSTATANIASLAGITRAAGPWANLADVSGNQQLQGQGTTSRDSTVTTNLSARVTNVLPNGNLVIMGVKDIQINSERQSITVRGVIRPSDLSSANTIPSDLVADLEVRINGKGVVGDSIRRPFILYRILLGLLPF